MDLPERFTEELVRLGVLNRRVLVAVSGGPDSVALLDLLSRVSEAQRLEIIVGHADHGIHPSSGAVAATVRAHAASCGWPFELGELQLGAGASETDAREARYRWLEAAADRHAATEILTAHHADDQAETVLMRVLGGSGPAGLAGMASRYGRVVRPLLPFRREELAHYVHERGLAVWTDPANADPAHLRSWLRTDILPEFARRIPEVVPHLLRTARLAAGERMAWDTVLDLLPGLEIACEPGAISVAAGPLAGYDSGLAEVLIRALARRVGCSLGPARALRLVDLARTGRSGTTAPLGGGWSGEQTFGRLRIYRHQESPAATIVSGNEGALAWGGWTVRWSLERAPARQDRSGLSAWFPPQTFTLRAARAGERIRPLGGNGNRLLVRCLQDARVPRGRRQTWPVLEAEGGGVVWLPGVCRADALVPQEGAEALRVDATDR